jgi:hypothetical protein
MAWSAVASNGSLTRKNNGEEVMFGNNFFTPFN